LATRGCHVADPYINWYTANFLNACVDLQADEAGVYSILITLMADKDGPIDDDSAWLARRCNLSTRRFNQIRVRLIDLGKIQVRNGMLGNRTMLEEVRKRRRKSNQASDAANARWAKWRSENKPQLPFDEKLSAGYPQASTAKTASLSRDKVAKLPEINPEKNTDLFSKNSQNSVDQSVRTHPDSRARAESETNISFPPSLSSVNAAREISATEGRTVDSSENLSELFERISEAAGFSAWGERGREDAIEQIRRWIAQGFDLETVILPAIRQHCADYPDPTGSLKRFDQSVRHLAAQQAQKPKAPAPTQPILQFEDEDFDMIALRRDLLDALGPVRYVHLCHPIRFLPIDGFKDRKPLKVILAPGTAWAPHLLDEDRHGLVNNVAKRHGFTDVWGN